MKKILSLALFAALFAPWVANAQGTAISTFPWSCNFENAADNAAWTFQNAANGWYIGSATQNGGDSALYVSNDNGATNSYSGSACVSYAYLTIDVTNPGQYALQFDWKCNGESTYDFLRVAVAPAATALPTDYSSWTSTSVPSGFTALDGGSKLNLQNSWQTQTAVVTVPAAGTYRLIFVWRNDGSVYNVPPAAIDNIYINELTCPQPTALSAIPTADQLALSWTAGGTESEWLVVINDSIEINVYDTTYSATNLEANTPYTVKVYAVCGAGDTSMATTGHFRTSCVALANLPYSYGFEDAATGTSADFPACWTRINDASGTVNYYPYVSNTASYVHSGSNGLYWYHSTTTTYADNEYAVLPPVDLDVYDMTDLTLAFYAKTTSASYHPQPIIGVMTNPTDATTFVPVRTLSATDITTNWQMFEVSFAYYTGTGAYIAIKWPRTSSTSYMVIDDIFLTDAWCNAPSNVTASASFDAITLNWEGNGGSSFTVVLGTDTITNVMDTTYTFTNLTPNTLYNYSVATECSDGNSMYINGSIRTFCNYLDSLPYTENFDGVPGATSTSVAVNNLPSCWNHYNVGTSTSYSGYPMVYNSSTYAHSGTNAMRFYTYITAGTYADQYAILPITDSALYPINTLRLNFWMRSTSTSYASYVVVGVMTNPSDPSTFVPVQTVSTNSSTTYANHNVMFGTYTGPHGCIAIKAPQPTSSYNALLIDDITLELMPSCPNVISHHVTATASAARVTWNVESGFSTSPDSYEVSYGLASGTPTTVTATDPMLMLTGLSADSTYNVSVSTVCDGTVGTPHTFTFHTQALPCIEWDTTGGGGGPVDTLTVGTPGTSTTNVMPVNTGYNYSYTQHLILASHISTTGPTSFSGIAFDYAYSSPMTHANNCQIYMGNTSRASFTVSSPADSAFVPYSELQLVYQGPLNCTTNGYNFFQFNQGNFMYDGTSNIVVAIVNNSGSYDGTSYVFRYETASSPNPALTHRVYNNNTPYGPTEMDAARANQSYWRTNMKLVTGGGGDCLAQATCAAPGVTVEEDANGDLEVNWLPGYQETSWDLDYRAAADTAWTNVLSGTSLTEYTFLLSDLQPNTLYTFRVTANCTDTLLSSSVAYTTPCGAIATLPFSEDFESYGSGTTVFPSCWYKLGSTADRPYIHATTSYGHNNTHGLYFYAAATGYCYAIMPRVSSTLAINTLQVSFWARQYSTSYNSDFEVGVMTDPTDATTFVSLGTVHPTGTDYEEFDVSLANYTGTGHYIAFRSIQHPGTSAAIYLMLDDVTLDVLPACPRVGNVAAENITMNSATITWDTTSAFDYEVQYGPMGFTLGSGTSTVVSGIDSLDINGLTANTAYDVYVRGLCGADTGNWSSVHTFRTSCGMIDVLPFFEDFENQATTSSTTGTPFIPCWALLNNGTSYGNYPYLSASTTYNHTTGGGKGLYWYGSTTATTYSDYMYLILPQIDTVELPINTLQLSFWAKASSASYNPVFEVGVLTSTTDTTFESLQTININGNTEWTEYVTSLSAHQGAGSYVAIRALRPSSTWYAYVDDITLDAIPACPRVEDLHVTNIGLDSIAIAWSDTSSNLAWNVEYDTVSFAPGTGHMTALHVLDTFCVIAGLDSGMTYHIYVYPDCGTDVSERHITATTLAASPATVPYSCDFESAGVNGWDFLNGNEHNYWMVGNATGNPGRSLYVTNNGSSNSYDGAASYVFATRTFHLSDIGEYAYSFDWKCNGESSFDFLRAALVPVGTNLTPGDYSGFDNTSAVPAGGIALDGSNRLNLQTSWQTQIGTFNITTPGNYMMVFLWRNDGSVYNVPPAAIDNITLVQNTCAMPQNVTAALTGDSISLTWTPGGSESAWELTLGSTTVVATTPNYTFTGLTPNTNYPFSIRSICGVGDTSLAYTEVYHTPCGAVPLPYSENFDGLTTGTATSNLTVMPSCWEYTLTGSSTYQGASYYPGVYYSSSYAHSGSYSLRLYGVGYFMLPPMSAPLDSLQLTFWNYTTSTSYGLEVGVMEGNTFVPIQDVTLPASSTHAQTTVYFGTYTGTSRIIAFRNYYTTSTTTYYSYNYIDDVVVEYLPTCPPVDGLHDTASTTNSITIDWIDQASAASWQVECTGNGITTTTVVTAHPATITGLTAATAYQIRVRPICSATDTGNWCNPINAFTGCDLIVPPYVQDFDAVTGTTYSTAGSLPPCWGGYTNGTSDTYSPHVVSSGSYWYADSANSLIMTSGSASYGDTKIVRLPQFATPVNTLTLSFWMSTESSTNGYLLVGYMTSLDYNSFVTVDSIHASSTTYHGSSSGVSALGINDTVNFASVPSTAQYIAFKWVYTTSFYSCCIDNVEVTSTGAVCNAPSITSVTGNYNSATMNWVGSSTNYEVAIKAATDANWSAEIPVSTNSYTFTGLQPNTSYQLRVRQDCDTLGYSAWAETTFTTDDLPCLEPTNVHVTATTVNSATLAWTPGDAAQTTFEVRYSTSGDTTSVTSGNPCSLTNLLYATEYSVSVRAICAEGIYSDWSDTITFSTDTCGRVSNVHTGTITATTAVIEWSGSAAGYEVAYGDQGTTTEQCERVTTTSTSYTLTGLDPDSYYDVYVRSVCAEGAYSDWSPVTTFHTLEGTGETYTLTLNVNDPAMGSVSGAGSYAAGTTVTITATPNEGYQFVNWTGGAVASATSATTTVTMNGNVTLTANFTATQGIDDVDGSAISLYPNPASSTVTLSGLESQAQVTIVDMNGREVYSGMAADGRLTINVSGMTQGAYFVRITGEQVNAIRKLIVR